MLGRLELADQFETLSATIMRSRELRETARRLCDDNQDLRDFLRESLLRIMAQRAARQERT